MKTLLLVTICARGLGLLILCTYVCGANEEMRITDLKNDENNAKDISDEDTDARFDKGDVPQLLKQIYEGYIKMQVSNSELQHMVIHEKDMINKIMTDSNGKLQKSHDMLQRSNIALQYSNEMLEYAVNVTQKILGEVKENNTEILQRYDEIKLGNEELRQSNVKLQQAVANETGNVMDVYRTHVKMQMKYIDILAVNEAIGKSYGDMQKSNAAIQIDIDGLQKSNEDMHKTNAALQFSNAALQFSNAELQESNGDMQKSNAAIQISNAELQKSNAELQERIDDMQKAIVELRASNTRLQTGNAALRRKCENVETRLTDITNIIKTDIVSNNLAGSVKTLEKKMVQLRRQVTTITGIRISSVNTGRLEVEYEGVWGSVCDDSFDQNAASVACRQLGKSPHGANATTGGDRSARLTDRIWLDDLGCDGSEEQLVDCQHCRIGKNNCGHSEDVYLVCRDKGEEWMKSSYGNVGLPPL